MRVYSPPVYGVYLLYPSIKLCIRVLIIASYPRLKDIDKAGKKEVAVGHPFLEGPEIRQTVSTSPLGNDLTYPIS